MTTTDKRFQFWRVLVALAHQDHKVTAEEREFIISKFEYIDFSEDQKSQLLREMDKPQDATTLFDSLDSDMDRAECLHMAHTLFGSDNEFHPAEERMYNRLKKHHDANIDKNAVMEDYKQFLADQKKQEEEFEEELEQLRDRYDFLSGWKRFFKK